MASENRIQGDKPSLSTSFQQSNEELASLHPQDRSDNITGIFNVEEEPVRYCLTRDEHLVPESYGQGMPFHVNNDDFSLFPETGQDYLNKPVSDFSVSIGNVKEFDLNHAFGDSVDATNIHANDLDSSQIERNIVASGASMVRGLETCGLGREHNADANCQPWLIENQFVGSASLSGHDPTSEELAMSNSFMTTSAQPNHPETLVNFLSLRRRTKEETNSKCNVPSGDSKQSIKRVAFPILNTFPEQNIARGSLDFSSNMANGFSSFHKSVGEFTGEANEDPCGTLKVDGFSTLGQNAAGFPHQAWSANDFPSRLQMQNVGLPNADGLFHRAQSSNRFSDLLKNNGEFSQPSRIENGGALSHLEVKEQYHLFPTSWSLGQGDKGNEGFANIDPNTSFQGFSTDLSMPYHSIGMPNAAWFTASRMPSSSSLVGFTPGLASGPIQNPQIRAVRNFSPGPFTAPPFIGLPRSIAWQGQSGPFMVPFHIGVPRSMVCHGQSEPVVGRSMSCQGKSAGQPVQANTVSAAQATEGSPFSNNVRVQPASKGIHDQSQASIAGKPSKSMLALAHTTDQEIPEVNFPSQSSSVLSGPSLKRGATISPPNAHAAVRRKTRSIIPSSLSTPTLNRITPPHAPPTKIDSLSPQVPQNVRSHRPIAQTSVRLPSLPRDSASHHIKWQDEVITPSGFQCPICKRDLSYTPEGPVHQPENLLPTSSVLPCGHYFHSSCLLRITPDDRAGNPPCIPCSLDGKI